MNFKLLLQCMQNELFSLPIIVASLYFGTQIACWWIDQTLGTTWFAIMVAFMYLHQVYLAYKNNKHSLLTQYLTTSLTCSYGLYL